MSLDEGHDSTAHHAARYTSQSVTQQILHGNIRATLRQMIVANQVAGECGRRYRYRSHGVAFCECLPLVSAHRMSKKKIRVRQRCPTLTCALIARGIFDA